MNRLTLATIALALTAGCLGQPDPSESGLAEQEAAAASRGAVQNVTPPVITGSRAVGSTLTVTPGTWTGAAPLTTTYKWARCAEGGGACVAIAGATSPSYTLTGDDPRSTLKVVEKVTDANGVKGKRAVDAGAISFAAGTVCNASGVPLDRPATLEHVIVIVMENRDADELHGDSDAPYFNELVDQCGTSTGYLDNTFSSDINSLSHYLALTSGSNCNTGVGSSGSGCVTDDSSPASHMLTTDSIFEQAASWTAYQEDMPNNRDWGNPASGTEYWVKHNPPAYYTGVTDCGTFDVGIDRVSCSSSQYDTCSTPSNAFSADLANDTLPAYAFVTPDIENDMHDGDVTTGDNWLHTYLPLILASPAYLRGETAVYVLWDEQGSFNGGAIPNLFLSPYIQPTTSSAVMNHFAALRAAEAQLGIGTYLGCASGTAPGGGGCPVGSTTDLRAEFNF